MATWTPLSSPVAATPAFEHRPDSPARPIIFPNPVYPPDDLKKRIRGVVVLRVLVSETGNPIEIVVAQRARGRLTEAAIEAVRSWRFEPAVKNGRPLRTWATIKIPFEAMPFPQPTPTRTPEPPTG